MVTPLILTVVIVCVPRRRSAAAARAGFLPPLGLGKAQGVVPILRPGRGPVPLDGLGARVRFLYLCLRPQSP